MGKKYPLLAPIVKWVGGKRQLLDDIVPLIPKHRKYVEPFVGGGAVIFELQPNKAVINDYNEELINVYEVVRDNSGELLELLKSHKEMNNEEYFYKMRSLDRSESYNNLSNIERAARILYLNKTCYNGLFRVNKAGQFNTPYGKYKNPNIVNQPAILSLSNYLNENDIIIKQGDYKQALKNLRKDAFVYFDPPYMPISSSSSFTGYTEGGFGIKEQEELKKQCDKLHEKGIKFMLSNSDHPMIKNLYASYNINTVSARRNINSKGNKRGEINEILVTNYDEKGKIIQ